MKALVESSEWVKSLSESIRPIRPLVFKAVIPICAKEARLSNLKDRLRDVFSSLHPLGDPIGDDEKSDPLPRLV